MAKYSVKFACGHVAEVELYGPEVERMKKIGSMREYWLCPDCYEQSKLDEIEKLETELGLPSLTGSEKQVKLARGLRTEYLNDFFRWFEDEVEFNKNRGMDVSRDLQTMEKFKVWLKTKNTAKFWINLKMNLHRPYALINAFVQDLLEK